MLLIMHVLQNMSCLAARACAPGSSRTRRVQLVASRSAAHPSLSASSHLRRHLSAMRTWALQWRPLVADDDNNATSFTSTVTSCIHTKTLNPLTLRPANSNLPVVVFAGSRYVSWLPSFSVEVRHTHLFGRNRQRMRQIISNSQFDSMVGFRTQPPT